MKIFIICWLAFSLLCWVIHRAIVPEKSLRRPFTGFFWAPQLLLVRGVVAVVAEVTKPSVDKILKATKWMGL